MLHVPATHPYRRKFSFISATLLLALLIAPPWTIAQSIDNFSPSAIVDTIPSDIYRTLRSRNEQLKLAVTGKGKVPGYLRTLYDQRFEYVVKTFNEDYLMVDDPVTRFVQSVLRKIYQANPQLRADAQVYVYRSEVPNAVSYGDGTIAIMLGLLAQVESEDVLAFILCHELAHYHQGHADKNFARLAELNYDKTLKKQIDAIRSSPYEKYSRMKALFGSLELSLNKHSRASEFEADSVALVYFRNTSYDPMAPLRCMQILGAVDSTRYSAAVDFRKYFNFKEFPFKDSWTDYKRSDLWTAAAVKTIPDSARTHPACELRFKALMRQMNVDSKYLSVIQAGTRINAVTQTSELEIIHSLYHQKQYGRSLFKALTMLERSPANAYGNAMVVKNMYELYKAQKNHVLARSLDFPHFKFPENYDRFLNFIHKLRLGEMSAIAYNYAITRPDAMFTNEEFVHALWTVSRFDFSKLDSEKVKEDYLSMFPNGRYRKQLQ